MIIEITALAILLFANYLDYKTTIRAISKFNATEINPLGYIFIKFLGLKRGTISLKAITLTPAIAYSLTHPSNYGNQMTLFLLIIVTFAIVAWNYWQLHRCKQNVRQLLWDDLGAFIPASAFKYDCRTCTSWCAKYPIHWYCHRKEQDRIKRMELFKWLKR